jgi:hypothetical protein
MSENSQRPLVLGGVDRDAREVVQVFDLAYRLNNITRSVEKKLTECDKKIREVIGDDDADGDKLVPVLAEALDAMLDPEGNNKRRAKTVVMEKWKADELSIDGLRRFADDLQERAVAARPT